MENKALAYGSLYLDEGESWIVAKRQLKKVCLPNVIALYFDILGNEEDREKAEAVKQSIESFVKSRYPHITEIHCNFSLNSQTNDKPKN